MSDDGYSQHHSSPDEPTTPQRIFVAFETQIERLDHSLRGLYTLMDRIRKYPAAFDEEDQRSVQAKIDGYEAERSRLKDELHRREHLYSSTVKRMEQALATRMTILQNTDSETSVLEMHPDLMELFVQKQSQLTEMLQHMKSKLASPDDADKV